mmetsp:Transcript_31588/g.43106  ORF Transcript_31588/g.43106 Transcript_31588/m.43106 type:complete len:88 (-) Transcript_31588:1501-1764(-)
MEDFQWKSSSENATAAIVYAALYMAVVYFLYCLSNYHQEYYFHVDVDVVAVDSARNGSPKSQQDEWILLWSSSVRLGWECSISFEKC